MNKSSPKKQKTYNQVALNAVAKKYGITKRYVRECIRGDRERATISATIKKEYAQACKKVDAFIKKEITHSNQ